MDGGFTHVSPMLNDHPGPNWGGEVRVVSFCVVPFVAHIPLGLGVPSWGEGGGERAKGLSTGGLKGCGPGPRTWRHA